MPTYRTISWGKNNVVKTSCTVCHGGKMKKFVLARSRITAKTIITLSRVALVSERFHHKTQKVASKEPAMGTARNRACSKAAAYIVNPLRSSHIFPYVFMK